jgi:hypothetical protein
VTVSDSYHNYRLNHIRNYRSLALFFFPDALCVRGGMGGLATLATRSFSVLSFLCYCIFSAKLVGRRLLAFYAFMNHDVLVFLSCGGAEVVHVLFRFLALLWEPTHMVVVTVQRSRVTVQAFKERLFPLLFARRESFLKIGRTRRHAVPSGPSLPPPVSCTNI